MTIVGDVGISCCVIVGPSTQGQTGLKMCRTREDLKESQPDPMDKPWRRARSFSATSTHFKALSQRHELILRKYN